LHDSSGNMVKIIMQQKCSGSKQQEAEVVTAIAAAWWQPKEKNLKKEATIDWWSLQ